MAESSFLNPAKLVHAAMVHEGMKVADFGAGSGFVARALGRAVGPGGVVWAVDQNRDLLPRIKNVAQGEGLKNIEVMQGDVSHLGGTHLPENYFDMVFICNTLFAMECKGCVAGEAARVLKPGGKVALVDWAGTFGGLGPREDHVVTQDQAREVFEQNGFVAGDALPAGAYHWGCILKKKSQGTKH
ncbi:MAG: class I SAM-dependent methyltransferase [Patescibacteria group bacterium]